jgi:hypothetical protein
VSCFLSNPIYPINRTCLLALFRVHAHTHAHDKSHILLTKLSSLKAWPSTNTQVHSFPLTRQASRFRVAGHTTTDCDVPSLIDCGSTGTWTALHSRSTPALPVLLSPRPVSTTYTLYYLLLPTPPALAPPTRLLSNYERCITQPSSLPSACHCYLPPSTFTWPSEAPPRPGFVRRLLAKLDL